MRDHIPSSLRFASLLLLSALVACGPLPDDGAGDGHEHIEEVAGHTHEHGLPEPGTTEPDAEVFEGDASFEGEETEAKLLWPSTDSTGGEETTDEAESAPEDEIDIHEPAADGEAPPADETEAEESAPEEGNPAPAPEPMDDEPVVDAPTWTHKEPSASCSYVKVVNTDGAPLNLRAQPTLDSEAIGVVGAGKKFRVRRVVPDGGPVDGRTRWFKIKKPNGLVGYISARFAKCVPRYGPKKFLLPFKCGEKYLVSQGNNGLFSHNGRSQYAFDFAMPRGTPIKAARKGVVIYRRSSTRPGDPCWNNGGSSCLTKANYVVLKHPDGTRTMYAHLNKVTVQIGERVSRGQTIGKSGNTGWSSGPHLHFAREVNCSSSHCMTRKMRFADVQVHDGRPRTGDRVKSGNCP
jgi:murein DD-endopeptidase MepM/ murein hydrolase activator NlpD